MDRSYSILIHSWQGRRIMHLVVTSKSLRILICAVLTLLGLSGWLLGDIYWMMLDRGEMKSVRAQLEQEVTTLRAQVKLQRENLLNLNERIKDNQRIFAKLKLERDDLKILGARLNKEVITLSAMLKEELAAMKAKHHKEISGLSAKHKQALVTMKANHHEEVAGLSAKHKQTLVTMKANHHEEVAGLSAKHRQTLVTMKANHHEEVGGLSAKHNEEMNTLRAQVEQNREKLLALQDRAAASQKLLANWNGLRKKVAHSLPRKRRSSLTGQQIVGELETTLASIQGELEGLIDSIPTEWPASGWLSSRFGRRRSPWTGKSQFHSGIDIANRRGTPVYATGDAVVEFAGRNGSNGRTVVLKHGQGITTHYGHLSKIYVKKGDRVRKYQKIGNLGNTGKSTNPHLHYEVRVNGTPVNPRSYLLKQKSPPP